nr:P-selectin [Ciona intestinalis]|eukprot:XP_002125765.3 P-selectin [Ciona intestinalis]
MKFLVLGIVFVATTEALQCWTCQNAANNEECLATGQLKTCLENEESCQTEVRTLDRGVLLFKRCKQGRACDNNFVQNPRAAWMPSQCNHRVPSSVCRCCCDFDRCNEPEIDCLTSTQTLPPQHDPAPVPTCQPLPHPRFGHKLCSHDGVSDSIGTTCAFTCNPGFQLIGTSSSVCLSSSGNDGPAYNNPTPECKPTLCRPVLRQPQDGRFTCTRSFLVGSVCSYICNPGFALIGQQQLTCGNDRKWSDPAPVCMRMSCSPPHTDPMNGDVVCTDGNMIGSLCVFTCNPGFMLQGPPTSTCVDDNNGDISAVWDQPPPICQASTCPPVLSPPNNGVMSCNNGNNVGSVCSFTCDMGHVINGSPRSVCNYGVGIVGEWSSPAPLCDALSCINSLIAPPNGSMSCTNGQLVGSECSFSCIDGYSLIGSPMLTCVSNPSDETDWNGSQPRCQFDAPITCEPVHVEPSHGSVICTNTNMVDSSCSFACNEGYALIGEPISVCVGGPLVASWSSESQRCEPITCEPIQVNPTNGRVTCSNINNLHSICSFVCDDDYQLIGATTVVCNDDGDRDELGVWSTNPPSCARKMCSEAPPAPSNGFRVCSDGNYIRSQCEYGCTGDYYRRVGPLYSTCMENINGSLSFDNEAPVCELNQCRKIVRIQHGNFQCTNQNQVTSQCSYQCDASQGYTLFPRNFTHNTCLNDTTWSLPRPCCARSCPPYAVMDLVIVMDSSSSIRPNNWRKMTKFTRDLISMFEISPNVTQVSVFRYNKNVDKNTQILLKDHPNSKEELLQAFDRIPYNGSGTQTGKALKHVHDVILAEGNGNRHGVRDVVVTITDGKAADNVTQHSLDIRGTGALTYAIGIRTPGRRGPDRAELGVIAGSEKNLFLLTSGFEGFNEVFARQLSSEICGDPCGQEADAHPLFH